MPVQCFTIQQLQCIFREQIVPFSCNSTLYFIYPTLRDIHVRVFNTAKFRELIVVRTQSGW
jgi:hypothetical protein